MDAALTIAEFLQNQATKSYYEQTALSKWIVNAELEI